MRFDNVTKIQIVQLYLIPLLVIGLLFQFFNVEETTQTQKIQRINYKDITQKEILAFIDNSAKELSVEIEKIEFKAKSVVVFSVAEYQTIILFLSQIASYMQIQKYELVYKENKLFLTLQLKNKGYQINQNLTTKNISNPFVMNNKQHNGYAIVNQQIYSNGNWYQKGDRFESGKIIKIDIQGFWLLLENNTTLYKGFDNE